MHNRKNIELDDQPKKTCWSIVSSVLSNFKPKNLLVWYLFASSAFLGKVAAQSSSTARVNSSNEPQTTVTTYLRNAQKANVIANIDDVVFPVQGCNLVVKKLAGGEHPSFDVASACDVTFNLVEEAAADNRYVGSVFDKGVVKRTFHSGGNGYSSSDVILNGSDEPIVTERRSKHVLMVGGGHKYQESTRLYTTSFNGCKRHAAVSDKDTVRPARGSKLFITPENSSGGNANRFFVEAPMMNRRPELNILAESKANEFVGDILEKGKVKRSYFIDGKSCVSELDFSKGENTVTETLTIYKL